MSEFTLPASPQPISGTDTSSPANTIPMDQSKPVEQCRLEKDALRGILVELKRGMKIMQERQDALHKCMTGRNLKDTQPGETGYRDAVNLMGGAAMMTMGLDQIAFATGIKIE